MSLAVIGNLGKIAMAERKIVVCKSESDADAQRQVLEHDGYQTSEPKQLDLIGWDATRAGGTADIRENVWVVDGSK